MLHLTANITPILSLENKLFRMQELKASIKVLQAEYDMLETQAKENQHFGTSNLYMTTKGLVLATYDWQKRTLFQSKKFEAAQPDLYAKFSETKDYRIFLLKK